jgi:hypothetical protein
LRPVQPNGDTSLSTTDVEHIRAAESLSGRQLIQTDGLHLGASAQSAREASLREEQTRERGLLALLSSARHELRSPLQSIQGFADLLAAESYGSLGREQRVFVEHIVQSSFDLSRALDACFELVQAELSHNGPQLGPVHFRRALEDAITLARSSGELTVDLRFGSLPADLSVEADSFSFAKAVGAIITALLPGTRGPLLISASLWDGKVEVLFGPPLGELRPAWRSMLELSRRGPTTRVLLWLRLASALLLKAGARLEASESYDRIRMLLPLLSSG